MWTPVRAVWPLPPRPPVLPLPEPMPRPIRMRPLRAPALSAISLSFMALSSCPHSSVAGLPPLPLAGGGGGAPLRRHRQHNALQNPPSAPSPTLPASGGGSFQRGEPSLLLLDHPDE